VDKEKDFAKPIYIPFTTDAVMFLINSSKDDQPEAEEAEEAKDIMKIAKGKKFIEIINNAGARDYDNEETTYLPLITHPTNRKSIISLIYGDKNLLKGPAKKGGSKQTRKKPKHKKHSTRGKNRKVGTSNKRTRRKKHQRANKTRSA